MSDVKRMLLATDPKSQVGIRDRAIILTLVDTGVRVSELCSMTVEDTNLEHQRARVFGKTGERFVPLGLATAQALDRDMRRWSVREGPLDAAYAAR